MVDRNKFFPFKLFITIVCGVGFLIFLAELMRTTEKIKNLQKENAKLKEVISSLKY